MKIVTKQFTLMAERGSTDVLNNRLGSPDTCGSLTYYTQKCNSYKKANEMHNFSTLFDKVRYMFRTGPLSIIRTISTLCTRIR
jgi:hypothetical protein